MTLALAHGQYSHHFRPLSSSEMRSSSSRSWHVAAAVAPFPSPPAPAPDPHARLGQQGLGTGSIVLLETFFTIYVPFPRGVTVPLSLSLLLSLSLSWMSLALSCMAFNNAHIFMARSDEMGTGFWTWTNGWRERRTNGRTDGGIITFCVIFLLAFLVLCVCVLFAFGLFVCCCLQLLLLKLTSGTLTHTRTHTHADTHAHARADGKH